MYTKEQLIKGLKSILYILEDSEKDILPEQFETHKQVIEEIINNYIIK